ncbi:hypothetical protein [Caulobacter sp. FWC2]|uniref:hypothetical protein n=1 Tax=Caulobacter sp. FWC2 TaxID=69664 RepID=UPI000C1488CB|nr:hypothetical protein [Caulobacter sp. FWC2]PIB92743.1 hypothetical protein CSW62_14925 [Caulobacter sp. FWC2]
MTERACFIIAPIGAKLSALAEVIVQSGWRVLNSEEDAVASSRRGAPDLIARADAVIVVDPWVSSNLLVETGYALGRGLPVLLVAVDGASSPAFENEPTLAMLPRVRTKITDAAALRFHIPAFLDGVEKAPHAVFLPPQTAPLKPKSSSQKSRSIYPQSALEQRLLDLFDRSPEIAGVAQDPYRPAPGNTSYRPDFAIWLADPVSTTINPVLVEVTRRLEPNEFARKLNGLRDYAREASAGMALLIEDNPVLPLTLVELNPVIVRVGLLSFEHLILEGRLIRTVTQARNRAVHGFE